MTVAEIGAYAWERLPLILLFSSGYVVYRIMAATRITDGFVSWALTKSRGSTPVLLLYIIAATAVLSSFIPNAIAVLTLLPVLKKLDREYQLVGIEHMTTVLMVSAIYGAGIGGMGSMIGSPANAVLIAALDVFQVAGREQINFFNWFLWSVPLVAAFILAAWFVAAGLGVSRTTRRTRIDLGALHLEPATDRQHYGGRLFWGYMGFWVLDAVAREAVPAYKAVSPVVCLLFTGLFLYLVFFRSAPANTVASGPLLSFADLLKDVPRRGLVFILVLVALFAVVTTTGLDTVVTAWVGKALDVNMPYLVLFLATVGAVIFLTEALSNTAVVAAFFTVAYYVAQNHGHPALPLMVAVGVSSTCAFMTPIATPANGLAFGEMRGASLTRMLGLGFVLNVLGAVLMTLWLSWILPIIYGGG